jgi:hypothetical protein
MKFFISLLLQVSVLVLGAPTQDLVPRDRIPQSELDWANNAFPRIYWDGVADDCDAGQFRILVEATRMALQVLEQTGAWKEDLFWSTGWNRYFVRDSRWLNFTPFAIFGQSMTFVLIRSYHSMY